MIVVVSVVLSFVADERGDLAIRGVALRRGGVWCPSRGLISRASLTATLRTS